MLDLNAKYEILSFSVGDPKATKALNEITSIINTTETISITETQNILNDCGINIDV